MEIERYRFHGHPLTLCEIEGVDGPPCPVCHVDSFFDGHSCGNCEFHPEKCSVCECKPSGSFYYCRECGPRSPFIHKPCTEFPPKIQIALRPNCSLRFVKDDIDESNSSDMYSFLSIKEFDCHFCEKSQKGDKFSCDMCNFQICCGCADILIKYQDREHIQHFRHHHPLAPLEISEADGTKRCELCLKEIHGQSYCCAPCKFYIHKPCSELLQEVKHPFHPQHYLTLENDFSTFTCDACGIRADYGFYYRCDDCDFVMHHECLSRKPNVKYQGHDHDLLTLVEDMSCKSQCHVCYLDIENTFYLRCFQCRLDFHVQCGPAAASLPPIAVHKSHNHPLSLVTESVALVKSDSILLYCDDCKEEINPNHPSYGCVECDQYKAHVRCAITDIQLDERERHKHFSHRHFLVLLESENKECYACKKLINQDQPAYGCDLCRFYLHQSCFELPTAMYHISHSHYFSLRYNVCKCEACSKYLTGLFYYCRSCGIRLDLESAFQHPSMRKWRLCSDYECKYHDEDQEEGIGHYSHYHHLKLSEVGEVECKLCQKKIHGRSYGCAPCMFHIHKSCAELPQRVWHPFHPHRCLTIDENTSEQRHRCEACCFYINPGLCYQCDDSGCPFYLHLECASSKPNIKYEGHAHLLILVQNMSHQSKCEACHWGIEGTFFARCVECDLNFHVQCGPDSLPPTVENQHHDHPLNLANDDSTDLHYCGVCEEKRDPTHPSYCCVECEYYAHMHCVITEIQFNKREKIKHFSHDHFLFLVGNKGSDDIKCYACNKLVQAAESAYGCDQCRYYLHKSCIELPRQIQHLFHRHPLTLKSHLNEGTKYHRCGACDKKLGGFFYQCSNCFVLDVDCALLQLGVQFEDDESILTLITKLRHAPECRRYLSATTGALDQNCVKCNFVVYLLRSPLPQTVECSSHQHPLTLTDKFADDDHDTQICDICEEDRDPEVSVYYCADCDFIAEFVCIISEVILTLQKKSRDVPLRSIIIRTNKGNKMINESLTLNDLFDLLTSEEEEKLAEIQRAITEEEEEIRKKFSVAGHEAEVSTSSEKLAYPDEDLLAHLAVLFDEEIEDLIEKEEWKGEVVDVGDYKTIPRLAGVLKTLTDKYGDDIGNSCTLPHSHSNFKSILMIFFCATVHSMCNTRIQDVTNSLLYTWWLYFKMARRAGFKVEFLFDHFKRVVQHRTIRTGELVQITSIHQRYDDMIEISKEIDKLSNEIDVQAAKLDLLRRQTQLGISNISFQSLRSEAARLSEFRELGMMKAGMGAL